MKCENPQRIWNKYLNKFVLVPCNKCRACQIMRCHNLSHRCKNEMASHKWNIFFTLTYDNEHVPCMFAGDDKVYRGISRNEVIETVDSCFDILPYPIPSFPDAMSLFYYPDVQLFLKRLREYVNYKLYGTKKMQFSLRYFLCAEYGTDKHRSHYHGIIHCNNTKAAEAIIKAIPKCWTFCDWRALFRDWCRQGCPTKRNPMPQYSQKFTSSYVANYVSCCSSDNPLYQISRFRPFVKYSKRPVYGLSSFDRQVMDRIADREDCGRLWQEVYNAGLSVTFDVLSLSCKNSFFPKSLYFDKLPYQCQYGLYWQTFTYSGEKALMDSKEIAIKDGGDSLTNHCIKIFKACKRFLKYYGLEISEYTWIFYLYIRHLVDVAYESAKMYMSMKRFDGDMCEYVLSSYNNFIESWIPLFSVLDKFIPHVFDYAMLWNKYNSPRTECDIGQFLDEFKSMLLPKHFNGFVTGF